MNCIVAGRLIGTGNRNRDQGQAQLDVSYTASMQKELSEAGNLQLRLGDTSRAMRDAQKATSGQSLGDFSQNQRQLFARLDALKKVQSDFASLTIT